jgi:hypothetical protein
MLLGKPLIGSTRREEKCFAGLKVATLWGYCSVPVSILPQEGYEEKRGAKGGKWTPGCGKIDFTMRQCK